MRTLKTGSSLTSRAVSSQVLSAYGCLTSVFGMGTGGPPSHRRRICEDILHSSKLYRRKCASGISIKSQALGVLVQVRSTPCGAPTPCLSTLSSTRRLTISRYGKPHLKAGFTLRCFQRLSLPNAATRLHGWRHDRYTVGPSTPVLSYWGQSPSSFLRPRWIWTELSHDVLNPAHVPL